MNFGRQELIGFQEEIGTIRVGRPLRVAPVKPVVHCDILGKTDIRVGKIELRDGVSGSQKLVRLIVVLKITRKASGGPIVISMNGVDLDLNANR